MHLIRVIIPDSHGSMIDRRARDAFLSDLKSLNPDEIIMLGDHVDAGGLYSKHSRQAKEDMEYSYCEDLDGAAAFLDAIQERAPNAKIDYLEGNHEYHIERWAVENLAHKKDVESFIHDNGPAAKLKLDARGIKYYRRMEFYDRLSIPNTIKRGKVYFTHGIGHNKFATAKHADAFGANVVHGHTHRAQAYMKRTVDRDAIGAWCPGTLARLQPTYRHTEPTDWTHGYAVQFVNSKSGRFLHINVAIVNGESLLLPLTSTLNRQ